jgi:hypothetical protein
VQIGNLAGSLHGCRRADVGSFPGKTSKEMRCAFENLDSEPIRFCLNCDPAAGEKNSKCNVLCSEVVVLVGLVTHHLQRGDRPKARKIKLD